MGFDLTNERIQDTYEQLLQISGSTIVDGTGSVAEVSIQSASYADFAVTASFALNAGDIDTASLVSNTTFNAYTSSNDSTFTAYTSSTSASLADINNQIDALEAGSGSADWDLLTNKPNGLVSSSAQTVANLEGGDIVANTLRLDSAVGSILSSSALSLSKFGTTTFLSGEENIDYLVTQLFGGGTKYEQTANSHTFTGNLTGSNQILTGDLVVNGTASFSYLQSITGSAKIIGDAYIILNNDTPTERYAGLVVQDSGSTNNTASFEFDGQTNDWFYEYTDDGGVTTEFGTVMFGPGYNTKGSHVYPSNNTILKGTGDHHIVDSNITDDGTSVTVSTSLTASAFSGDGSGLTNIPSTLGNGTGGNLSIVTQNVTSQDATSAAQGGIAIGDTAQIANVASTDAIAIGRDSIVNNSIRAVSIGYAASNTNANYSVAIGNQSKVSGEYSLHISLDDSNTFAAGDQTINIGKDINNPNGYSTAIGHNLTNNGTGGNVLIGRSITTSGDYSIGIGEGVQAQQAGAVAIGQNANSAGNSVAIGAGATMGSSYGFAGGYNAKANNDASIAIGGDVNVSSNQAIAIGTDTSIDGSSQGAVSLGQNADISTSTNAVVVGRGAGATGANSGIAIGSGSKVTSANEINIGDIFTYNSASNGEVSLKSNVETTGQIYSPTFAGTIASSTSSVDFDNGNFATLDCSAGATYIDNPTNLKSGTTYTLIITNGANISNYNTSWKFAGGTQPTLSAGTDILTCVSDGTNLYATALADFS